MRWDELFADLEGQLEAGLGVEEQEVAAEEERLRLGRLGLRDRIAAIAVLPAPLAVRLADGAVLAVRVRTLGRDWIAGDLDDGAQAVLPLTAVVALLPTPEQCVVSTDLPPGGALTDRLGVPFVLRDLARRRRRVQVVTRGGVTAGTIDRVGRDHLDVAVHPSDTWRRESSVRRIEIVALSEVLLVRVD